MVCFYVHAQCPVRNAGPDRRTCSITDTIVLSSYNSSFYWGTWGWGNLLQNTNNAVLYVPSITDIEYGSILFIMNADRPGSCPKQTDTLIVTFIDSIVKVNAGLDHELCNTAVFAGTANGGIYRYTNNTPAAVSAASLPPNVKIYPNPSPDGNIVVQVADANEILEISLFDMTGRKISSMSSASGAFALGSQHKGLYVLEVRQGNHVYTNKLSLGD